MAKDKCLKSKSSHSKRKLNSHDSEVSVEEPMGTVIKKKRTKVEVEEASGAISHQTTMADDNKQKKEKKRKKKEIKEETKMKQTETSDPPCHPEVTHEPEEEEALSPEEERVLERKMKKILKKEEKKRLKLAGETQKKTEASGPSAPQQALDYLTCWAENRTQWKFQKTRQTWLLQHMFDSEKIPDEQFSVLLHYLDGLRGGARETTVQKAITLVKESGQAPEDVVVQQRAHRAKEVIQLLS